jgi:hypothetical protein
MLRKLIFHTSLLLTIVISSCDQKPKNKDKVLPERLKFDHILGIKYHEVKRRFSNGLSFNEMGFQQEPTWIIQFKSNDTVMAWSPQKQRMQPFFLMYDHGDVYNFAKEYFRIKKVTKDSLVFQRLQVQKKEIANDIRSDVNITYYSENYINNVLKTTPEVLQQPTRADTLYIAALSKKANNDPKNPKTAFAGRQPVQFIPKSEIISVMQKSTTDPFSGRTAAYDYLFPEYRIVISKAYKDFGYEFQAIVDAKGGIHLTTFGNVLPEHREARKKSLEAIINVYLRNLLKVIPGSTLGIPHSSEITLIVVGRKS